MGSADRYSQGPWKSRTNNYFAHVTDFAGHNVAFVPITTEEHDATEQTANAAIVVAAPSLLDACRLAETTLADLDAAQRKGYLTETKKLLRSVLAPLEAQV